MLRHLLVSIVVVALAGVAYFLFTPHGRQLIDRVYVNWDRAEHQALYRAGEPLAGTPDLAQFDARLQAADVVPGTPIYIRIYKLESELEVWTEMNGRFEHFATYPICMWSGPYRVFPITFSGGARKLVPA